VPGSRPWSRTPVRGAHPLREAASEAEWQRTSLTGVRGLTIGHIFDEDDVFRVTQALDRSTTAIMVLLEHVWARKLLDAVGRASGIELMNEWIDHDAVLSMGPVSRGIEAPETRTDLESDQESTDDA